MTTSAGSRERVKSGALITVAVIAGGLLVWQMLSASAGVPDPTDPHARLSHGAVVIDSALLVLREGLECILVLAAVLASFLGENRTLRKPVAVGGVVALGASVLTWFAAVGLLDVLGSGGLAVQAGTGLLAVLVLLVVMNWFFHKVYWTGWISHHHQRRKKLLAAGSSAGRRRLIAGLALLGFTSVYREGFEIVLFLQSLRLKYGAGVVLEGVAIGLAFTAGVGYITFFAQRSLPYKRMLVCTGVLLGGVLIVMVGESVQEMQLAGWLPATDLHVAIPGWMGLWFAIFPTIEGLAAQLLAAGLVIASYVVAEQVRVKRPRRRGELLRPRRPSSTADPVALEARSLRVRLGDRVVLDDASLRVAAGEVVALIAPSGAGKSTLLRSLVRLVEVESGVVELDGEDVCALDARVLRRRVGLVMQTPVMLPGSVAENLAYANACLAPAAATAALDAAGLAADFAGRTARELSGGERARVAVARALARAPEVLLLDEPTAALDEDAAERIGATLVRLAATGLGICVATHDTRFAATYASREVRMAAP